MWRIFVGCACVRPFLSQHVKFRLPFMVTCSDNISNVADRFTKITGISVNAILLITWAVRGGALG